MANRGDILVYDSLMGSNIPRREKSAIRNWYDTMTGGVATALETGAGGRRGENAVVSTVQAFRQLTESGAVAAGLGVMHAEVGLDIGKVPVDATLGIIAPVLSIFLSKHEISRDLLNIGTAGSNAYLFRKGYAWAAAKKMLAGGKPAGDVKISGEDSDDPIVQVAKNIK